MSKTKTGAEGGRGKVCLLTPANFLQADRRAQKEAASLLDAGYAVDVVFHDRQYGIPERHMEHVDLRLVPVAVPSRQDAKGAIGSLLNLVLVQSRALPRLLREALKSRADVYLCHNAQSLAIGALAARLRGARYYYDCRDLWREVKVAGSGASLSIWGVVESMFIRRASGVFVVCDMHADYLAETYCIPRPTVVHNCPPRWDPPPSDILRRRYGIPPDHTVVIHTGSIQAGVGIDRLVDAAEKLAPGITVVILGYFQREAYKQEILERIAQRPNVIFAEPVSPDEMATYLVGADIGVVLYVVDYKANQSLPNKLFEYMMCGLAVVTNGYSDTRRVVETSRSGLALDPMTADTLAEAINRLHRDKELLRSFKTRAREAALTTYVWDKEAAKLLAVIEAGSQAPSAGRGQPSPEGSAI